MKISICDDDYSVCHFIEHTVLEYAKLKNIHIDVEVTQSKKSLFENFEEDTDMIVQVLKLANS